MFIGYDQYLMMICSSNNWLMYLYLLISYTILQIVGVIVQDLNIYYITWMFIGYDQYSMIIFSSNNW